MRNASFALIVGASLLVSSAAFAGPPCRSDTGGVCGTDYDGWMATYHRTNPGKVIMPMSPGGYGILPNGQVFNQGAGGVYYENGGRPGVITRTVMGSGPAQGQVIEQPVVYGNPVQQQGRGGVANMIQRTMFAIMHREDRHFHAGMAPTRYHGAPRPEPMRAMTERAPVSAPVAQSQPLSAADVALLQNVYK